MLARICTIFEQEFGLATNTKLLGGADEPVYLPADGEHGCNRLFYREDYLSSALHEIAHWCIAGEARRKLEDFGYWYNPDGRTVEQQRIFEAAEVKPQALEWMFSVACGQSFRLSVDNLEGDSSVNHHFAAAVVDQARLWSEKGGLHSRGDQFLSRLALSFKVAEVTDSAHYQLTNIL